MPEPTTQQERELKPCPFCGNEAEFRPYKRDGLTLKCKSLGCVTFNQRTLRKSLEWLEGKMVEHWNARSLPPTDAPRVRELQAKYNELLFAVARKHPGESRHETALRYIRNAEAPTKEVAALARHEGEGNGR